MGAQLCIGTDCNGLGKLQYLFGQNQISILDTEYGADVTMRVLVPVQQKDWLEKSVIEQTNGSADLVWEDEVIYAEIDKEVVVFEKK